MGKKEQKKKWSVEFCENFIALFSLTQRRRMAKQAWFRQQPGKAHLSLWVFLSLSSYSHMGTSHSLAQQAHCFMIRERQCVSCLSAHDRERTQVDRQCFLPVSHNATVLSYLTPTLSPFAQTTRVTIHIRVAGCLLVGKKARA